MPVYTGETPTRSEDDGYTYTFLGWSPDIVAADADADYTALFDAAELSQGIDEMKSDTNAAPRKMLINGQLFILTPDGKIYNITGQEVK
jgi:hypothetical protein